MCAVVLPNCIPLFLQMEGWQGVQEIAWLLTIGVFLIMTSCGFTATKTQFKSQYWLNNLHGIKSMLLDNQENLIVDADIINDPSASFWLKEQIVKSLDRDPIDMLNDIDILVTLIKARIVKE